MITAANATLWQRRHTNSWRHESCRGKSSWLLCQSSRLLCQSLRMVGQTLRLLGAAGADFRSPSLPWAPKPPQPATPGAAPLALAAPATSEAERQDKYHSLGLASLDRCNYLFAASDAAAASSQATHTPRDQGGRGAEAEGRGGRGV